MFRRLLSSLIGQKKSQASRPIRSHNRVSLNLEALEARLIPVINPIGSGTLPAATLAAVCQLEGRNVYGSGVLITPEWVLTAAHVVEGSQAPPGMLNIWFGTQLCHDRVGEIYVHSNFVHDLHKWTYDVALIH